MSDRTAYTALIHQVANACKLPFPLLEAQILEESSGDPNALRYEAAFFDRYVRHNPKARAKQYGPFAACSVGLLQIMVEVAYELGFSGRPEDLFDPLTGLSAGAEHMAHLWQAAGGEDSAYRVALACYNGGAHLLTLAEPSWPAGVERYVTAVYGRVQG